MSSSPLAGKPAPPDILTDIPKLVTAYFSGKPDYENPEERVVFGTSGHRGSSFKNSFNETHILAITQAICIYRKSENITGPLFIGFDTHALSVPAYATAMEVLAANGVEVMTAAKDEYTPTPVISHAILQYNKNCKNGSADGIIITPSHNPPADGGFKYNTVNGGPAAGSVTSQIEKTANEIIKNNLREVKRTTLDKALRSATTHIYDYLSQYVNDLSSVVDMELLRDSKIRMGVDPLGGAGVHYWGPIAEQYRLNLTIANKYTDPTFRFMTVDYDGQIRMDPSSADAMQSLISMKDRFDISFACDTDHDRHGIVTRSSGLMNPNHYLSVAIDYLLKNRQGWHSESMIGKTVVSSTLINRIAGKAEKEIYEVPVGFKWFADGLFNSSLCFGGEESAGASFSKFDGSVWTTDKDGIIPALLSAEITARSGKDPGDIYKDLTNELGDFFYGRTDAKASQEERNKIQSLNPRQIKNTELAGDKITGMISFAPGNGAPIGGLKVITENGWFAARPSGTEDIYKIYAESYLGNDHLQMITESAQQIVNEAIK